MACGGQGPAARAPRNRLKFEELRDSSANRGLHRGGAAANSALSAWARLKRVATSKLCESARALENPRDWALNCLIMGVNHPISGKCTGKAGEKTSFLAPASRSTLAGEIPVRTGTLRAAAIQRPIERQAFLRRAGVTFDAAVRADFLSRSMHRWSRRSLRGARSVWRIQLYKLRGRRSHCGACLLRTDPHVFRL